MVSVHKILFYSYCHVFQENTLNVLINEDTSQHDVNTYEVEVLQDEIDALQNHTSFKHGTQEIDKSSYNKRLKKDSNNKEEFLKIAKTQAEALLVMLSVAFLQFANFLQLASYIRAFEILT